MVRQCYVVSHNHDINKNATIYLNRRSEALAAEFLVERTTIMVIPVYNCFETERMSTMAAANSFLNSTSWLKKSRTALNKSESVICTHKSFSRENISSVLSSGNPPFERVCFSLRSRFFGGRLDT